METSYSHTNKTLTVGGTLYKVVVVVVEDHLENIVKAITNALTFFTTGESIALDFSDLCPRGSKTSHAGVATGAASFAKAFADLIKVMSTVDAAVRKKPVAILKNSHPDLEEYSKLQSPNVVYLTRSDDWNNIKKTGEAKVLPNWELSAVELEEVNRVRGQQASPFQR